MDAPVAPLWLAQEQGFFAKYGIDPELVLVRTTSVHIAGLVSGHIDISYTGGSGILSATVGGIDLRFIASFGNRLTHVLVTRPEIQKPKDLRRRRIGVVSIGGTQWITTKLGLEHLGLDEQRDQIQILAIGDQTVLRKALEGGSIEATFLNGVMAEDLKHKGYRILAELSPANIRTVTRGVAVRRAFLQKNRELTTSALKAMVEGLAFVLSPARKPAVIRAFMERLKISDASAAELGYQYLLKDLDMNLYPSIEGLQNLQRFIQNYNPRVAEVKAVGLVDSSILRSLEESGFVKEVFTTYGVR
jgi:NitT/TauT family transport system substrate-binding protein